MWYETWEKLSDREREELTRVINLLLTRTYILRDQYDSRTKNLVINKDFRLVERHYTFLEGYLKLAGWHLQIDSYLGVIALYNRFGSNRYRLDKSTTYFLYTLRLIYEEQREKVNLAKHAFTTVGEMAEKMYNLGLMEKKPADVALREGLTTLKRFQIIDKIEGDWANPETRIIIYPSILLLVTNERISNLFDYLQKEGEDDETNDQDALN